MKINSVGAVSKAPFLNPRVISNNFNVAFLSAKTNNDEFISSKSATKSEQTFRKTYDSFTGLRDKNFLINVLNSKIEECDKTGDSLSIAIFDMDNFKSINEVLGYKTGDDFIKAISSDISDVAKKHSVNAYRFGGEEFILVFDDQPKYEQEQILNSVIKTISSDDRIQSKGAKYKKIAENMLEKHNASQKFIDDISESRKKKEYLLDFYKNLVYKESRNDPYFSLELVKLNSNIKITSMNLLLDSMNNNPSNYMLNTLYDALSYVLSNEPVLTDYQKTLLNDYFYQKYDRSFQIHQVKKWLSDFNKNKGFSITGGLVEFDANALARRTPIDIVNDAGEALKEGKNCEKGTGYTKVYASF